MKFKQMLESRGYKVFMSRVYGFGATIVLIGALFKLTHWTGANTMLTVGLLTEGLIFFFSAFEQPHVDPDWSLLFPEFKQAYHGVDGVGKTNFSTGIGGQTQSANGKLDEMFEKAGVSQAALERLGEGINRLAQNADKMSDISNAVAATKGYTDAMIKASQSVTALDAQIQSANAVTETNNRFNKAMAAYIEKVSASAENTDALNRQLGDLSKRMSALNTVYGNMLSAMNVKA